MPKLSERGAVQFLILLLLLAGIVGGLFLVQKTQIFKPKATNDGTRIEFFGTGVSADKLSTSSQTVNINAYYVASSPSPTASSSSVPSTPAPTAQPSPQGPTIILNTQAPIIAGQIISVSWSGVSNPSVNDLIVVSRIGATLTRGMIFTSSCTTTPGTVAKASGTCNNFQLSTSNISDNFKLDLLQNGATNIASSTPFYLWATGSTPASSPTPTPSAIINPSPIGVGGSVKGVAYAQTTGFPTQVRLSNTQDGLNKACPSGVTCNFLYSGNPTAVNNWKLTDGNGQKTVYAQFLKDGQPLGPVISAGINYTQVGGECSVDSVWNGNTCKKITTQNGTSYVGLDTPISSRLELDEIERSFVRRNYPNFPDGLFNPKNEQDKLKIQDIRVANMKKIGADYERTWEFILNTNAKNQLDSGTANAGGNTFAVLAKHLEWVNNVWVNSQPSIHRKAVLARVMVVSDSVLKESAGSWGVTNDPNFGYWANDTLNGVKGYIPFDIDSRWALQDTWANYVATHGLSYQGFKIDTAMIHEMSHHLPVGDNYVYCCFRGRGFSIDQPAGKKMFLDSGNVLFMGNDHMAGASATKLSAPTSYFINFYWKKNPRNIKNSQIFAGEIDSVYGKYFINNVTVKITNLASVGVQGCRLLMDGTIPPSGQVPLVNANSSATSVNFSNGECSVTLNGSQQKASMVYYVGLEKGGLVFPIPIPRNLLESFYWATDFNNNQVPSNFTFTMQATNDMVGMFSFLNSKLSGNPPINISPGVLYAYMDVVTPAQLPAQTIAYGAIDNQNNQYIIRFTYPPPLNPQAEMKRCRKNDGNIGTCNSAGGCGWYACTDRCFPGGTPLAIGCAPTPDCRADVNRDGIVNARDISWAVGCQGLVIGQKNASGLACTYADVNQDVSIDQKDIQFISSKYGKTVDLRQCPEISVTPVNSFLNLSSTATTTSASFNFSYTSVAPNYQIDVSTQPDMSSNLNTAFGSGKNSPVIISNPSTKWDKYQCGAVLYWQVIDSVGNVKSPIQQVTITCPDAQAKRVFVTSTVYSGNLGGLVGADAKCQTQATTANLGGTWKAWLSDSKTSAKSRLSNYFGPFKLVNGVIVANNWRDLTDGSIQAAININELKKGTNGWPWTGTNYDGNNSAWTHSSQYCTDWTSSAWWWGSGVAGLTDTTGTKWSLNTSTSRCNTQSPLFCFEQ